MPETGIISWAMCFPARQIRVEAQSPVFRGSELTGSKVYMRQRDNVAGIVIQTARDRGPVLSGRHLRHHGILGC